MSEVRRILLAAMLVIGIMPANAAVIGHADFTDRKLIAGRPYWVQGLALKRVLGFQTVAAALYLPVCADPLLVLDDVPKYIEIMYLISIPKVQLEYATIKGITENVSAKEFTQLKDRLDRLLSFYGDVSNGDRIGVSYIPGHGTSVLINNKLMGVIQGEDFGRAFFAIWVGEYPVELAVKSALLSDHYEGLFAEDWCPGRVRSYFNKG